MAYQKLFSESQVPDERRPQRLSLMGRIWNALSGRDRAWLVQEYLGPEIGDQSRLALRQRLEAERHTIQREIEQQEARDRAQKRIDTKLEIMQLQGRGLKCLQKLDQTTSFGGDPLYATLWKALVVKAGVDIGNAAGHVPVPEDGFDIMTVLNLLMQLPLAHPHDPDWPRGPVSEWEER